MGRDPTETTHPLPRDVSGGMVANGTRATGEYLSSPEKCFKTTAGKRGVGLPERGQQLVHQEVRALAHRRERRSNQDRSQRADGRSQLTDHWRGFARAERVRLWG
jgi:hypothetical protein